MSEVKLTPKQILFIDCYIANGGNGTQAAEDAGYKGSRETLAAIAYENLNKPHIKAEIERRLSQFMTADEVLYRLTEIANADLGSILDEDGRIDLKKAKRQGKTRFLKVLKLKTGATNEISFEQYSRVEVLTLLGKKHKLFVDRQELSGVDGGPLKIILEEVNGDRTDE